MPSKNWTYLTESQDASSVGVSRKTCTEPWSLNRSEAETLDYVSAAASVLRAISMAHADVFMSSSSWRFVGSGWHASEHADRYRSEPVFMTTESLTHWWPSSETRSFKEDMPSGDRADWDFFASEVIESLAADFEPGIDQTTTRPATRLVLLRDFPPDIKEQLDELSASSQDGEKLYELAEAITEWLREHATAYQTTLAAHLPKLPTPGVRVLLSTFADVEIDLESVTLLHAAAVFMHAEDQRLAQAATTCLLVCGGEQGKKLVDEMLHTPQTIPHAPLIQGIVNLFSNP